MSNQTFTNMAREYEDMGQQYLAMAEDYDNGLGVWLFRLPILRGWMRREADKHRTYARESFDDAAEMTELARKYGEHLASL